MSLPRYARKVDTSQADIVAGLRACGYVVMVLGYPVDLLVYRGDCGLRLLECKTLYGKSNPKARIDKRQKEQTEFLALTKTPIVTTLEEALDALQS